MQAGWLVSHLLSESAFAEVCHSLPHSLPVILCFSFFSFFFFPPDFTPLTSLLDKRDPSWWSSVTFLIGSAEERWQKLRGGGPVAGGETKPSVSAQEVIGCSDDGGEREREGGKSQVGR